jgi:hypothetical protein
MQTPSISMIFEKKEDGKYTDDAVLYQYILKYPILAREQSTDSSTDENWDIQIKLWDIMKWLITSLPEFKLKYRSTNVSMTIPKVRRRIKGKLDDLVNLELLLSEKRKQKWGDGTTDSFKFTIFGKLLGWIITSIDCDNSIVKDISSTTYHREMINTQIFNSLQQIFNKGKYAPTTIDILTSRFISRCMQRKWFGNIVNLFKNALNDKEVVIETISDFLRELTTCNFKEQNNKVIFCELWDETIMKLEPAIKNIVLYNTKLSIERKMQDHIKAYQSYEKMWFKFKDDYSKVVVQCSCTNCENYTPVAIDIMGYKKRSLYSTIDPSNLTPFCLLHYKCRSLASIKPNVLLAACKACGKENSLRLSFFE